MKLTRLFLALSLIIVFATGVMIVKAAADAGFARFFLIFSDSSDADSHPWWDSSTVVDAVGGVHSTFHTREVIYYAYCPANCDNPENWAAIPVANLGDYSSLAYPVVAANPSGQPRMMWHDDEQYQYAECNANCTMASSWTSVVVPVADADWRAPFPDDARYFVLDTHGRPRFVSKGLRYTTCDANCTTATNWHSALLEVSDYALYFPRLVFNASDQPRVMFHDSQDQLVYLECNANCSQPTSWQPVVLPIPGSLYGQSIAFRLDHQGRPRLAVYYVDTGALTLRYAWSNTNPLVAANWSSYGLPYDLADYRTLDLTLDSQNRPHIAFEADTEDLGYARCTSNCETTNPTWQRQDIETSDELNLSAPIATAPGCLVSTWMLGESPSLALDSADRLHVSYYARHVQGFCGGTNSYNDAWAIRFARPSGTTPPTPPASVIVNGPTLGVINTTYTFTATVSPLAAATPITYVWQATGLTPQTHTGRGTSDIVTFSWPAGATGSKTVTVSATNQAGSKVGSTSILITATPIVFNHRVYLPGILK